MYRCIFLLLLFIFHNYSYGDIPRRYSLSFVSLFNRYISSNTANVNFYKNKDLGVAIIGGYKINDYFTFEVPAKVMGQPWIEKPGSIAPDPSVLSVGFNTRFDIPIYFWNPYIRFGFHNWKLTYNDPASTALETVGNNFYYGFGFQFYFTPAVALIVDTQRQELNHSAIHSNAVGFNFWF